MNFSVKAESKPIVLEPKPTPYLQHLHHLTAVPHPLNLENNNSVELVDGSVPHPHPQTVIEEDTKDPLVCDSQEITSPPGNSGPPAQETPATDAAHYYPQ